jgi:hypothetical protein
MWASAVPGRVDVAGLIRARDTANADQAIDDVIGGERLARRFGLVPPEGGYSVGNKPVRESVAAASPRADSSRMSGATVRVAINISG